MSHVRFIEHKGTRVILLDFAGIKDTEQALAAVAEAARFIRALPANGSALTCTDVQDTTYNRRIIDAFKTMTKANAPIVKAAAVVTDSTIHRAAMGMIALMSRRKMEAFASRDAALDWLVTQA